MSLFLDGLIILMLAVTIIYAVRLNSKLAVIRNQKDELAANLKAFASATDAAITAVDNLQQKGEKICSKIEASINKAQVAADDIEFLIDRASKRTREFEAKTAANNTANIKPAKIGGLSESELVHLLRQKQQSNLYAS